MGCNPPFGTDFLEPQGRFLPLLPVQGQPDPFRPGQFLVPFHFPGFLLFPDLNQSHPVSADLNTQQLPGPGRQPAPEPPCSLAQPGFSFFQPRSCKPKDTQQHPVRFHQPKDRTEPEQQSGQDEIGSQGHLYWCLVPSVVFRIKGKQTDGNKSKAGSQEKALEPCPGSQPQTHHRCQFGIPGSHALGIPPVDQLEQSPQQSGPCQRRQKISVRQSVEKQEQQSQGKEKNFVQLHFVPVRPSHKEQ